MPSGTLYFVTDEEVTERSDGTVWESYSGTGGGGAPSDLTYLTDADETADLPNSRALLAGTNVTFDDTTPGERTINASGGGGGGVILEVERILTNAEILTLNSSIIELLPTPASGFAYIPVGLYISTHFSDGAYSSFSFHVGGAFDMFISPAFTNDNHIYFEWTPLYNVDSGSLVDQVVYLYTAANPTGGDAANSAKVKFLYMLVEYP